MADDLLRRPKKSILKNPILTLTTEPIPIPTPIPIPKTPTTKTSTTKTPTPTPNPITFISVPETKKRARVLSFNEQNINLTQKFPISDRTYGFIKSNTRTARTPFPHQTDTIDRQTLFARLETERASQDRHLIGSPSTELGTKYRTFSIKKYVEDHLPTNDEILRLTRANQSRSSSSCSEALQSVRGVSFTAASSDGLTFNERRKLFDFGEYTITQGVKMSDLQPTLLTKKPDLKKSMNSISSTSGNFRTAETSYRRIYEYCIKKNVNLDKS